MRSPLRDACFPLNTGMRALLVLLQCCYKLATAVDAAADGIACITSIFF